MSTRTVIVFPSAARIVTVNSDPINMVDYLESRGVWLYLDVSAASGTAPTLDVNLQRQDPVSGDWVNLPGAAFTQKTGVVTDELTVYPTMTAAANDIVREHIGNRFRAVAAIGGTSPSFTFSLAGELLL